MNEPPLLTRSPDAGSVVDVHSHTLPSGDTTPHWFAGNASTGAVPVYPSSPVSKSGNLPCQVFAQRTSTWSPQKKRRSPAPPAAATSHSSAVGSRFPCCLQNASASVADTCTTGWRSNSAGSGIPAPYGLRNVALGTACHHSAPTTVSYCTISWSDSCPTNTNGPAEALCVSQVSCGLNEC